MNLFSKTIIAGITSTVLLGSAFAESTDLSKPEHWQLAKGATFQDARIAMGGITNAQCKPKFTGRHITVETDVTPVAVDTDKDIYKVAGIRLVDTAGNHWGFHIAERPASQKNAHFMELRLMQNKKWQYETGRVKEIARRNTERCWEYGKTYRMKMELDDTGVAATLSDPATGKELGVIRYEFTDPGLMKFGQPMLVGSSMKVEFKNLKATTAK